MAGLRRVLVLSAVVASLVVGDQRSSAADLPRLDIASRQVLNVVASLLPDDRADRGQRLYQSNCASCHGGSQGGNASDYPPRHNAVGHTWQHADCDLVQIVRNGPGPSLNTGRFVAPGLQMPAFRDRLTVEEIADILAHIKTFWTDEQRAAQAATTAAACASSS